MCAQEDYTNDIAKMVALQVMGRPLPVYIRNTAWSTQEADAEGLKLSINRILLR